MSERINVTCVVVTPIETNCFILSARSGECAVIDPGEFPAVDRKLRSMGISELSYILLTHGHFDHIGGAKKLKESYGGKIVISREDEKFFTDPSLSLGGDFGMIEDFPEKADLTIADGDTIMLGECAIKVMATPGHTIGSVCYIADDLIFSGDTLFASSCGRTDFKTGNSMQMMKSLKALSYLPGDYQVLPGHMEFTTLETERKRNPYIKV